MPANINWAGPDAEIYRSLLLAIDELDPNNRTRFENDVERYGAMGDEAGQAAIYGLARDRHSLDQLPNGYGRALWTFTNEPDLFRRAEESRYTDEHRRGRKWDGYVGTANLAVRRDEEAVTAFTAAVRERFESGNVHVDIFDRRRFTVNGGECDIVQIAVYREGRPEDDLIFINSTLSRRPRRPVIEAALTYEPTTGVIEVVAEDRSGREDLVRFFARDLLAAEFRDQRLPWRRYDLSMLLEPFDFPTDAASGIESVRVSMLRLKPLDTDHERLIIECTRNSPRTVWEMAEERLGTNSPLRGGWVVTQARLSIRFNPGVGTARGKTLPVTISIPHGCDLKDRTQQERLIGQEYLQRWGMVRDA
jgi:hypothetical protein